MPNTTQLLLTAVPNGTANDGTAKVSLVVGPRLVPDPASPRPKLADFVSFSDWPAALAAILPTLRLEFVSGTTVTKVQPVFGAPEADSVLWKALFPAATTPVGPRTTAAAAIAADPPPPKSLRSFPAAEVHRHVVELHGDATALLANRRIAATKANGNGGCPPPPDYISLGWLKEKIGPDVPKIVKDPNQAHTAVDSVLGKADPPVIGLVPDPDPDPGGPVGPLPPVIPPTRIMHRDDKVYTHTGGTLDPSRVKKLAFSEAFRFYDRTRVPPGSAAAEEAQPPLEKPALDFHSACAAVGDYPRLLRKLGLVVDVTVKVPAGIAANSLLRVAFEGAPPDLGNPAGFKPALCPFTALDLTGGQFEAAPSSTTSPIAKRVLDLADQNRWLVTELDLDAAVQKYLTFAHSVSQLTDPEFADSDAPADASIPAQSGGGITVLRKNRDGVVGPQVDRMTGYQASAEQYTNSTDPRVTFGPTLHAEDLVRGFRIDVGLADPATGSVVAWKSLCQRVGSYVLRRPGQAPLDITGIGEDEGYVKSSAVGSVPGKPDELFLHEAMFGWDGWSLVAPRPGKTIGENSGAEVPDPELDENFPLDVRFRPAGGSLPALRYGRTYRLRARAVDLAGNSLGPADAIPDAHASAPITYRRWEPVPPPVVLPSKPYNEGESAERLVIRSSVHDDGRAIPASFYGALRNDRLHGPFSGTDGLDRGYEDFDERHLAPPKTSELMAEQHGMFDRYLGAGKPASAAKAFYAAASRESGTFSDTKVTDPHPPYFEHDLLLERSIHVAKHTVTDPEPPTELPLPHGGALKQGEYIVHDPLLGLKVPYLPDPLAKGAALRGLPADVPNRRVAFPGTWPEAAPFRLRVEEGTGSPEWTEFSRTLTVFLPKAEIATVKLSSSPDPGDVGVLKVWSLLTGKAGLTAADGEFASLLAVAAAGEDWMVTPFVELTLVHAVEKPLERPQLVAVTFDRLAEETFAALSGTVRSHAKSTGRLDVEAAWSEWLDDPAEDAPRRVTKQAHVADFRIEAVEGTARIGRDDERGGPREPFFRHRVRHEFGDTRHRTVTYTPVATTRFLEYFKPEVKNDPELVTRIGDEFAAKVPSSRRPEPPEVLYVVPTFRWEQDNRVHQAVHRRRQAGVRIYLERPWFSSGDDEMLAVLIDDTAPAQYATRWGTDPVWGDPATPATAGPKPADFPNAAAQAAGLTLVETAATVTAMAFTPEFDRRRGLWYVDVDLNAPAARSYFPLVRFAVARYQPYALPGCELSKVVLAEFTQLPPERTTTVRDAGGRKLEVTVAGAFAANAPGTAAGTGRDAVAASRQVLVTLQKRGLLETDDLAWKPAGPAVELGCAAAGDSFVWTGVLAPSTSELLTNYRIVVEEHELYQTDKDTEEFARTVGGQAVSVARRPIYSDTFGLGIGLGGIFDLDITLEI
ncbi:hypothetical protein [Amycolatopsis sp. CA-230715]|uniref:hypothetical protein n=1 Tax=Amycolatopsis sp. CA-230715 TaxID=2745196 RepID=UPI001C011839|nr:hypothetical protein [Amycolatopsis sp. CA-230715]QWF84015.1 hypothetical protein HUW46_07459 [Amycolatopsis sp. CA-230715]